MESWKGTISKDETWKDPPRVRACTSSCRLRDPSTHLLLSCKQTKRIYQRFPSFIFGFTAVGVHVVPVHPRGLRTPATDQSPSIRTY